MGDSLTDKSVRFDTDNLCKSCSGEQQFAGFAAFFAVLFYTQLILMFFFKYPVHLLCLFELQRFLMNSKVSKMQRYGKPFPNK